MAEDALAVWMDGFGAPAGFLVRDGAGDVSFFYDRDYLAAEGLPVSLSLPLSDTDFGDVESRAFFDNLLPENNQLDEIMARHGIARSDVVGLLRHLGADCPGAISCLPVGAPPVKIPGRLAQDYVPIDDALLQRIVRNLADSKGLPAEVQDPSPVAGVQRKIALTLLPDRVFALPRPGVNAPTTHILKVPEKRYGEEARHEEAAALLAKACGLDVSVPEALKVGDHDALLIERFDRRIENGVVYRIHQEDFAQALGLPALLKYERNGTPQRHFDVAAALSVLDRTRDPEAARGAFFAATVFNLCVGNTDNHAKNHAVLYDQGATPRFAPLYDLLPIRLSRRFNHRLAFRLGAAEAFDDMTPQDLETFCRDVGLSGLAEADAIVTPIVERLEAATRTLRSQQMKALDDLIGRETERLVDLMGLPIKVRERDYVAPEGFAWA